MSRDALAAIDRIHNLLGELQDEIGPYIVNEDQEQIPLGGLLSEWVLLCAWTTPEDGETYITRLNPVNMISHHRDGLLFKALHHFPD